jgi:hypothetical protein
MGRNENDTHYAALNRSDVPQGRKGKHRKAVADILADLSKLNAKQAIKIPLSSLSSDEKYLYVWRSDPPKNTGATE